MSSNFLIQSLMTEMLLLIDLLTKNLSINQPNKLENTQGNHQIPQNSKYDKIENLII